jgi:hypothetical protein
MYDDVTQAYQLLGMNQDAQSDLVTAAALEV